MKAELERRFAYHALQGGQADRLVRIASRARDLAQLIDEACPESREKDNAIQWVESAIFWAKAAIERHE